MEASSAALPTLAFIRAVVSDAVAVVASTVPSREMEIVMPLCRRAFIVADAIPLRSRGATAMVAAPVAGTEALAVPPSTGADAAEAARPGALSYREEEMAGVQPKPDKARGGDGDTIFRTDLAGDAAIPVYTNAHIEDFRATASHLVVATLGDDGDSHLIVTDLDGQNERELPLPGAGTVTNLQSADKGDLIGYTFTDAAVGTAGAREALLFTASLTAAQQVLLKLEQMGLIGTP